MGVGGEARDPEHRDTMYGEENLTPIQHRAIIALIEQPTVAEAAKVAAVHRATIYRWLQEDSDFRGAYQRARRDVFSAAVSRLQQISSEAVEVLREVMNDQSQQGASRVGAAKAVLDYAVKATEQHEVIERIERLEGKRGTKWAA